MTLPSKVSEIMTRRVITARMEDRMTDAAKRMVEHGVECLPVVTEDNYLVGVLTSRDIFSKLVARGLSPNRTRVGEIMSRSLYTCTPETPIMELVKMMHSKRLRRFPVVDEDGKLVGIVTSTDVALAGWKEPLL